MKVTTEMIHQDLRQNLFAWRVMTTMIKFKWVVKLMNRLSAKSAAGKNIQGLHCEEVYVPSSNGEWNIRTRIYRPEGQTEVLPVMLYFHGGGYLSGLPEGSADIIRKFINTRPCVVIAPDYHKSYTKPFPAGFNDCYDTMIWARDNAEALRIRDDKIIVAGHSAGGGLTAAVTLKVRDTQDVQIAFQMPIYPMIDDQQPHDPERAIATLIWDTEMNGIGWNAYLSDLHKSGAEIPAYAAPARNTDYSGFPPTITFVGDIEPFYWETVDYVEALKAQNIDVAFKIYEGCYHGFDGLLKSNPTTDDARKFTYDRYAEFYDKYI